VYFFKVQPLPFKARRGREDLGYVPERGKGVFCRSSNTGTYAIEAAALMGYTDIRVIGVDFSFERKQSHFYGENKFRGTKIKHSKKVLRTMLEAYEAVCRDLGSKGITVVNESPCCGPLDDFMPREKSKWLKTS